MTFLEEYQKKLLGEWTDIRFHLPFLREIALSYPEVRVLELGTRDGNSTVAFMSAAEEVNGKVHSCDIAEPKIDGKLLEKLADTGRWQFTMADDLALSTEVLFDIIFIDTSHELYHTMLELRKFYSWVKPGGRLLLHDTEWAGLGVLDDAIRMAGSQPDTFGPVAWALDWFCRERKLSWKNYPGSFGLGEIRA